MYAGLSLILTGTSASGQRPIFVPVSSVSHESAASCGSRSQRSSAVWHTPAGALQGEHRLVRIARFRPVTDESVEGILMRQPPRELLEPAVVRPLRVSCYL